MEKGKILVVEDHDAIRNLCVRVLSHENYEVTPSSTGDLALELLETNNYNLMVTDLEMPGTLNGIKLLEEAKRISPKTDVVIMTGFPSLDSAIPALRSGAFDYLMKPVDMERLKFVVHRCLQKQKLESDLSHEKSMKTELEAAYSELRKMDELKESFLARVNDELKTPLTKTLPVLEMIDFNQLDSKNKKFLEVLRSGLEEMREAIYNLLLFSKEVDPGLELHRVPVQAENLLQSLIETYKPVADQKNISLHLVSNMKISPLNVDPSYLKTAFKHLLLNAIQFSKPNGMVTIELTQPDAHICIAFKDSGIGIPKEEIPQIFDGFYQVAKYLTRSVKGLGLGLAITKRIVEAHGGYITVKSELEKGSTFTIVLAVD